MKPTLSWPVVRAALSARAGWRRSGSEWHGPCPVSGDGKDTCWFRSGERAEILAGCRRCGTRLVGSDFRLHLSAVIDTAQYAPAVATRIHPVFEPAYDPRAGRVWSASKSVVPSCPGHKYLVARGVVARDGVLPPSVRWIDAARARSVDCRPFLPSRAVGALVYRYAGPSEPDTRAVQLEALDSGARRLVFSHAGKRPSVLGSWTDRGRRVFVASSGRQGAGCWLVEGPLDALAVVRLERLGILQVRGAAVFGVAGAPGGFKPRACWAPGPVVIASDNDSAGRDGAYSLSLQLRALARPFNVFRGSGDGDWSSLAHESSIEREALSDV